MGSSGLREALHLHFLGRPGSCAGPRHWDTQGDRRASPPRSRTPSLLGDSRGEGGEPRGQRCTQPLGALHGSLPRKFLSGLSPTGLTASLAGCRAPRHRHRTQTPGEVVKWLQRLVVGGPGRDLGRSQCRASLSHSGVASWPLSAHSPAPRAILASGSGPPRPLPRERDFGAGKGQGATSTPQHPAGRGSSHRLTCPGGYTKGHG